MFTEINKLLSDMKLIFDQLHYNKNLFEFQTITFYP